MATGDKLVTLDGLKAVYQDLNGKTTDLKSALALVAVSPGTPEAGAYSNVNGVLTFTANSNALAYSVDLTDYIGKIVCVKITSTGASSERLSAMVDDEDKIGKSLAERYILPLKYGKCFAVTADYPILKVSHYNSVGSSIVITVYENLLYNAAIVPDIITDIDALEDSVGKTGIDISSGLSNSYFTVSNNTISETSNNNSRSKVIDLTQYIGKRVWLKISTTATTSTRVSAIGNAQGTVNAYYTEAQINNSADGVFFDITSDYHYLYISWYYILGQSPETYIIWGLYDEVQQINEQIHPDVVYVDSTNASAGDGSKANPYNTLQAGINSGAEIVKVKAGTYAAFSVSNRDYPLTVMLDEMPTYVASATAQDLPKIHIEDTTKYNGVDIHNCTDVHLFDIWVDSSPRYNFNLTDIQNLEMTRCYANTNDTANFSTFRFVNVNAVVKDCIAWESKLDGFNIHGYGNTQFINCIAYDCEDDGISHHNSCTGCIIGGEFYGNGKGGISSPYGGAKIDVQGAYCHDNTRYGLYADSDSSHPNIYARVSDCLFVDNVQADVYVADGTVISWNTLYKTKSIQETATFTEYNNTVLS